jgi:enamine deaminase RidA (YjgF/YER057c/UK114 family)/catechol 2,3-dioxygenase-like lactoylglutathione lyase family enzyme
MVERINVSSGAKWENIVGYSRAVRIGNVIEVAGTTAVDAAGNVFAPGDPYAQTRFILGKIEKALHEAGATMNDVIRTRMYVVDITQWEDIGRAHGEVFRDIKPAATMVEVRALISPELLVEIEVSVVIAEGREMEAREFRFAFHARDFDRSVSFYRDTLGMAYTGGWDRPDGKGALLAAGGTAVVEIYGAAEGTTYEGPSPLAINLALRVDTVVEVDAWYAKLKALDQTVGEPENQPWGHRSFVVTDPDGIPVYIYCELD